MRISRWVMLVPVLAALPAGCGGSKVQPPSSSAQPSQTSEAARTALEVKDHGTIKGRVVYDGTPPDGANVKAIVAKHPDAPHCQSDPSQDSFTDGTWKIGKDSGVANVAIWLRPPDGKFFQKPADDKKTWKDLVVVDQPFCAFEPRVAVVYFESPDEKGKKLVPTGQQFKFVNSAPKAHNTKWAGDPSKNIGGNINLQPKEERAEGLKASYSQVININCDYHTWMKGYIWSLETPYAVVTDADGNFELKNVPAGVDLFIVPWHEQATFFGGGAAKGEKITVKAGETVQKDFKVKAK